MPSRRSQKKCKCCSSSNCPSGLCPSGSLFRRACGGAAEYVVGLDLDASYTTPWVNQIAYGNVAAQPFDEGKPTITDMRLALAVSTPEVIPGPQSAASSFYSAYSWEGTYKRIIINGSTYVFDGMQGMGITATPELRESHYDQRHGGADFAHYPASGIRLNGGTFVDLDSSKIAHEELRVFGVLNAQPVAYNGFEGAGTYGGQWNVSAGATATIVRGRKWKLQSANPNYVNGNNTYTLTGSPVWTWYFEGLTGSYMDSVTPAASVGATIQNFNESTDTKQICTGEPFTDTLVTAVGNDYPTVGSVTGTVLDPEGIPTESYALRQCPCALTISGTLWVWVRTDTGAAVSENDPPSLYVYDEELSSASSDSVHSEESEQDGQNPDEPPEYVRPPMALAPATFSVRVLRSAGASCSNPGGVWQNGIYRADDDHPATSTGYSYGGELSIGDKTYPIISAGISRVGPRLYRLSVGYEGIETYGYDGYNYDNGTGEIELHLITSGDCPTTVTEAEQFAQAYGFSTGGSYSNVGGQYNTGEPQYVPQNPAVSSPFTANAVTIAEASERFDSDPACLCSEVGRKCGICADGLDSYALTGTGIPPIPVSRGTNWKQACDYVGYGDSGTYLQMFLRVTDEADAGPYYDGLDLYHQIDLAYYGPGGSWTITARKPCSTDPSGSYTKFSSTGTLPAGLSTLTLS